MFLNYELGMKKLLVPVIAVVLSLLVVQQANCADRYWWLTSSDTTTFSLDTKPFSVNSDAEWFYFDVWIQAQYNAAGVQDTILDRKKNNLPTDGYQNLGHTMFHVTFGFNKNRQYIYKNVAYIDYATDGSVLYSYTWPAYQQFDNVIPNSIGEDIAEALLSYTYKNKVKPSMR